MDYDEFKCPICQNKYNEEANVPRLLLSCGHTVCTYCINQSISLNNKTITCPEDHTTYQNIENAESMPKNMTLIKLIKKTNENISSPKRNNTLSATNRLLESIKTTKNKSARKSITYCIQHQNRALEIICIDDKCKICTNCALFGQHKNHNVTNIDDFQKDIEIKAELLIDLFDLINQQIVLDENTNPMNNGLYFSDKHIHVNENKMNINAELLQLEDAISAKSNELSVIIKQYTNELIIKIKEEEKVILNDLNAKFNFLLNKVDFMKHFPKNLYASTDEWKQNAQLKLNIINDITDFEEECLKLIDDNIPNSLSYNDLIEKGETILSEFDKMNTFPIKQLIADISTITLEANKSILLKPILSLNNEIDITELEKHFAFESEANLNNNEIRQKNKNTSIALQHNYDENTAIGTSLNQIPIMSNIGYSDNTSQNTSFLNLSDDSILTSRQKRNETFDLIDFNNLSIINQKKKPKTSALRGNKSNPKLSLLNTSNNSFTKKQPRMRNKTSSKDKSIVIKTQFKNEIANFSRIDIGNEGAKAIAEALSLKHKVKEIKMARCKIGDDGAISIFKSIESSVHSSTIINLNIANNHLTDKTVDAILSLLNKNNSIKTIYLTNNTFSSKSKEKIKTLGSTKKGQGLKIFI